MTYLNIVNKVLRRLREDEVTTVAASIYSKLIGELVNDAKRVVEDAWNWSSLNTEIDVTTASGTASYDLTGTNKRSRILYGFNKDEDLQLRLMGREQMRRLYDITTVQNESPSFYMFNGLSSSGELKVRLYPQPNSVESLVFHCVVPQDDLEVDGTDDSTNITVSEHAVYLRAWANAISERGEDGGALWNEVDLKANNALADAISYDKNHWGWETDWMPE